MHTGQIDARIRASRVSAHWMFTGRAGGVSGQPFTSFNLADHVGDDPDAVSVNRIRLARMLGESDLAVMGARHGADVAFVQPQPSQKGLPAERTRTIDGFDGLVTTSADLALAALAADCVPLVFADPDAGVIGAAHCGWPGLVAGIVEAEVEALLAAGASRGNLYAVAGPAICGPHYPVPPQRYEQVVQAVPAASSQSPDGQPAVDVRAGVLAQLAALSVKAVTAGGCTFETADQYSYRRDGRTGRHSGAIVLKRGA